jgi:hypothetical protein
MSRFKLFSSGIQKCENDLLSFDLDKDSDFCNINLRLTPPFIGDLDCIPICGYNSRDGHTDKHDV